MSAGSLAAEQLEQCVRTACSELSRRLREGQPARAEEFLAQIPELTKNSELALELIYTEYVVREELGQSGSSDEWFTRFPDWTNDLRQLLEVHRQLCQPESVQSTGSKWQSLSRSGATNDSIDQANRSTAGRSGKPRAPTDPGELGRFVGNYQLLEEIGRGGMGVVYRARQLNLNRDVALKMILSGEFASPREMTRFQTEAQASARLHHQNIVQVYEVGAHQHRPFLSMELMAGGNLDTRLKAGLPAQREAALLLETVARAVHYAHEQGVIHRDLKPCNILLDEHDQPKVADFGLAKQLQEGGHECSRSGGLVGTPCYMAPESIGSAEQTVTRATDVYSLGVILYEMLTGHPPFAAETQLETLRLIAHEEPTPPSATSAGISRDLETICLKCLLKEPRRRYASAADLADDLGRYLRREPVHAKPIGSIERMFKWARRRPLQAAFIACLLISLATMSLLWRNAVASDQKARLAASNAERMRSIAEREKSRSQRSEYFHRIGQAFGDYRANLVGRADELLEECPPGMRNFEWNYLKSKCNAHLLSIKAHDDQLCSLAVSPDGKWFASGSGEWGWPIPGEICLFDAKTGQNLFRVAAHEGPIMSIAFSPDSQLIASASCEWGHLKSPGVKVWNLKGDLVWHLPSPATQASAIKFSPDGRRLAVGAHDAIQIWDIKLRKLIRQLPGHQGMILDLAYDRSGRRLASAGRDGFAIVHDWITTEKLFVSSNYSDLRCIDFSPDGQIVAFSSFGGKVFQVNMMEREKEVRTFNYQIGAITALEFSPEGKRMAISSNDGTSILVDATTGEQLRRLYPHNGMVRTVHFMDDGRRLVTGGNDGLIKTWDVVASTKKDTVDLVDKAGHGRIARARFNNKGDRLLLPIGANPAWNGSGFKNLMVYDLEKRQLVHILTGHAAFLTDATEHPNGKFYATSGRDQTVRIWDAQTGKELNRIVHPEGVTSVRSDPTGQFLISACLDGSIHIIDWETRSILRSWAAHSGAINEIEITADGRFVGSVGNDQAVRVWSIESQSLVYEMLDHEDAVITLAFSHSGDILATAGDDRTVNLWSMADGKLVRSLRGHLRHVADLDFSPDDKRIASCSWDWLVKIWDVESGEEALWLRATSTANCVAFHPDSTRLLVVRDGTIDIFDSRLESVKNAVMPPLKFDTAWHSLQAKHAEDLCDLDVAAFHYEKQFHTRPTAAVDFARRAYAYARKKEWKKCADDYATCIQLKFKQRNLNISYMMSQLASGDLALYRQMAEKCIAAVKDTDKPVDINDVLWYALLAPERPVCYQRMQALLENVLSHAGEMSPEELSNCENTAAWLMYRCEQYDQARTLVAKRPIDERSVAEDWLLKALLAKQDGDLPAARRLLAKAETRWQLACEQNIREKKGLFLWQYICSSECIIKQTRQELNRADLCQQLSWQQGPLLLLPSLRPLVSEAERLHQRGIGREFIDRWAVLFNP